LPPVKIALGLSKATRPLAHYLSPLPQIERELKAIEQLDTLYLLEEEAHGRLGWQNSEDAKNARRELLDLAQSQKAKAALRQ
jgi:hypothetical protein